jgi:hypothetical protein
MALVSTNFVANVVAFEQDEFKRQLNLLNLLRTSPKSKEVTARLLAEGPPGGFAHSIAMPQFSTATAVAVTGTLVGTNPYSEPTLGYSALTDTTITFNCNRLAYHQFKVGDRDQRTHVLGQGVVEAGVRESLQAIYQEVSEKAFDVAYTTGSFLSGTGGAGVDYDFAATSTANLQSSFAKIVKGFDSQNVPSGPGDRWLILNSNVKGALLQWGGSQMFEASFGDANDVISGEVMRYNGFNILFDNSVTSGKRNCACSI